MLQVLGTSPAWDIPLILRDRDRVASRGEQGGGGKDPWEQLGPSTANPLSGGDDDDKERLYDFHGDVKEVEGRGNGPQPIFSSDL